MAKRNRKTCENTCMHYHVHVYVCARDTMVIDKNNATDTLGIPVVSYNDTRGVLIRLGQTQHQADPREGMHDGAKYREYD